MTGTSTDVSSEAADREQLRLLLRSRSAGLNVGEQDLIEMQLRQRLDNERPCLTAASRL